MGSTHRLYGLKNQNISISDAFIDMKSIYDSLCIGDSKSFYHHFSLHSADTLNHLQSKFNIDIYDLQSGFHLYNSDKLIDVFETIPLHKDIYFSNVLTNKSRRDYFHYFMSITQSKLEISFVFSDTEDIAAMKQELIDVLNFSNNEKLIELKNEEIKSLTNMLIDSCLVDNGKYSQSSNGIVFSAYADSWTHGSDQMRPSAIKLEFTDKYIKNRGGIQNSVKELYIGLNKYSKLEGYATEGEIISDYNDNTYSILSKKDFLTFEIRSLLDLNKNSNFTAEHLELTSQHGGHITIDNFDWKDSEQNHLDNRVFLQINNLNDWDLQIEISKQISEEYYLHIESLINKELKFLSLQ